MSDHLDRDAEARAEVERLRTALLCLVGGWEDTGRSDLHPLLRGAALSAAGQVRDVLWPEEADSIRDYVEEVREAARAEALAGFEWETTNRTMPKVVPCDCTYPQHARLVGDDSPPTHVSFDLMPHRRLVGPWEVDDD